MGLARNYLLQVLTIGIIAFLCECISTFSSSKGQLYRAGKFISSLVLYLVVLSPLLSLFSSCSDKAYLDLPKSNSDIQQQDVLLTLTKSQLEKDISQEIYASLGIRVQGVVIELNERDDTVDISKCEILVNADSEIQTVKNFVEQLVGSGARIDIKVVKDG